MLEIRYFTVFNRVKLLETMMVVDRNVDERPITRKLTLLVWDKEYDRDHNSHHPACLFN